MQSLSNKILLVFCIIIFCQIKLKAQVDQNDINILLEKNKETYHSRAIHSTSKNGNVLNKFLNGSLNFYKNNISKQIMADCLYEISCSSFSQMAINEFGILKGIALTADRLSRCNRVAGTTINEFRINTEGKVIDTPAMYKIHHD